MVLKSMSAIDSIKKKLNDYPQIRYTVDDNRIIVEAASPKGFSVWMVEREQGITVGFDGWHEAFDNVDGAVNCFGFGLTDLCRLKVVRRGKMICSWTAEMKEGEVWVGCGTTGLFFVPFWKRKSIDYLANSMITAAL